MKRICYQCEKELTIKEVVEGQVALEVADQRSEEEGWTFEGWVHCMGSEDMFIREEDVELEEKLEEAEVGFIPTGLIVCKGCVEKAYEEEKEGE